MTDRPYLNPLLKWPGGKRTLAPRLAPYYKQSRRLVDPFVGGMAIPLCFRPEKCVIADINGPLINLYRCLKNGLVWDESYGVEFSYDKAVYYRNRDRFNDMSDLERNGTEESALLLYYLNKTGFNGLFRFNRNGKYNVAFGDHKNVIYQTDFTKYKEAMRGWDIQVGDFSRVVLDPTDFIYADPPYDNTFTKFSKEDFGWTDQERLAAWLGNHPGPIIASNSYTDRIVELYRSHGFTIFTGLSPRRISRSGDRTPATEMLAMKNID